MAARLAAVAPVLLALSIAARLAWTYLAPNGANFVDLHVYVGGAGALDHRGTLYDYVYADQTPDFPLDLGSVWFSHWAYLKFSNTAPVLIGEFGGRSVGEDPEGIWQRTLISYLQLNGFDYTYWSWNPNSFTTPLALLRIKALNCSSPSEKLKSNEKVKT